MFQIEYNKTLFELPPYLFAEIDALKNELKREGKKIIDLGIGDPDLKVDNIIINKLNKESKKVENHHYPSYEGLFVLRKAIANFLLRRYNISFDPNSEIVVTIGSKEAIFHFPFAFINEGDFVLIPNPAYPVYKTGALFAKANIYEMPLREEHDFFPVLEEIPTDIAKKAKILWINYPNKP